METGTKIAIGVGSAAVIGFGIYWFFIREGEDAAAAIIGEKPINEMTPAELKAMGGGKLNITESVLALLSPEQKAALKSAGTVVKTIKDEVVTPATASFGEESKINTVRERGQKGEGGEVGKIAVQVIDGIYTTGDIVKIKHPNYSGEFEVLAVNDNYAPGNIIYLDTPFVNKGTKIESDGVPIDRQIGTITIIAQPADDLEAAGGGRKRFLGKAEAQLRKRKQVIGKSRGKKGKELRKFIRTGNQHVMPKKPALFTKGQSGGVRKRRGADGSVSWANTHGNQA